MKKLFLFSFVLMLCYPAVLFAKDKDYHDAKLTVFEKHRPSAVTAVIAFNNGTVARDSWLFVVRDGDLIMRGWVDKSKAKEGEWTVDTAVKVRYDIKGGAVATRTTMYIQKPNGKDLETEIYSIGDAHDNEYCGTRKCDPESALKKMQGGK